jgi:hypothetical protein
MNNKSDSFAMIRAVKALDKELQAKAKKKGYKPNDIVFITRSEYRSAPEYTIEEKIEGSIVEWQRKKGLIIKK